MSRSQPGRTHHPVMGKALWILPVLALGVPFVANDYMQFIANLMLVNILVAAGFNIVLGHLGQLAFANTAIFGLGAYATGIAMAKLGFPAIPAWVLGALVGTLGGLLASVPALRGIRVYYLAIMTLAVGELLRWSYVHVESVTEGSQGLRLPTPSLLGVALDDQTDFFVLFVVVVTLLVKATDNLLRSRYGRAVAAIANNEAATASLGIATARYFVFAFAWSGFLVGTAGGMFAMMIGRVVPKSFGLVELITQFSMVMIGGIGNLAGSVIGGVVVTAAPELFRDFPGFEELFFATLLVLVLLFLPRGLASLAARAMPVLAQRYYRDDR